MLYKILHALKDDNPHSKKSKMNIKTLKQNTSGLAKGGGRKTKRNKPASISKKKNSKTTNIEKQYRQKQTRFRRNKWKNSK